MPTVPFSMRLDADLRKRLDDAARSEDRSASYVAEKAIDEYLKRKEYHRKLILEALEEAEKGVFISQEAMFAWIDSWDTENELPPPEPDIFLKKS